MCVCERERESVCVCVRERERQRDRGRETERGREGEGERQRGRGSAPAPGLGLVPWPHQSLVDGLGEALFQGPGGEVHPVVLVGGPGGKCERRGENEGRMRGRGLEIRGRERVCV